MTADIVDELLLFTAYHAHSLLCFRLVVFIISDHFSASLFLIDDVVKLLLGELAKVIEHEVPLRFQTSNLSFEIIVLVYLFDNLF